MRCFGSVGSITHHPVGTSSRGAHTRSLAWSIAPRRPSVVYRPWLVVARSRRSRVPPHRSCRWCIAPRLPAPTPHAPPLTRVDVGGDEARANGEQLRVGRIHA